MSARVYVRRFDRDEARRLVEEGHTQSSVAEMLGVSASAVWFAVHPSAYERNMVLRSEWQRTGVCPDCGAKTSRTGGIGSRRCIPCAARLATTSVRETELLCFSCREWKPDAAFPCNRGERAACRRGRHNHCRACQTVLRREYRHRNRVPCRACGEPCSAPNETRDATGLCRRCYLHSPKAKAAG